MVGMRGGEGRGALERVHDAVERRAKVLLWFCGENI